MTFTKILSFAKNRLSLSISERCLDRIVNLFRENLIKWKLCPISLRIETIKGMGRGTEGNGCGGGVGGGDE